MLALRQAWAVKRKDVVEGADADADEPPRAPLIAAVRPRLLALEPLALPPAAVESLLRRGVVPRVGLVVGVAVDEDSSKSKSFAPATSICLPECPLWQFAMGRLLALATATVCGELYFTVNEQVKPNQSKLMPMVLGETARMHC